MWWFKILKYKKNREFATEYFEYILFTELQKFATRKITSIYIFILILVFFCFSFVLMWLLTGFSLMGRSPPLPLPALYKDNTYESLLATIFNQDQFLSWKCKGKQMYFQTCMISKFAVSSGKHWFFMLLRCVLCFSVLVNCSDVLCACNPE